MTSATTRIDHPALFAIISSLADNKQAIGRRYAYWCNGAPALEAAVAAAAMTQDELGHARTLYPLLEDFVQAEADPSQVEPMTRTLNYALAYLDNDFQGWSDFVATNFLLAKAGGAVRAALVGSLERLWKETLCWFGPNDDSTMQQLYNEGIIDATPDELRSRYLQKIMPTLSSLDIEVPVSFNATTKRWELSQPLPWATWDAVARRLG